MASHKAYLPLVSSPVARKRYTSPTTAMVRPWAGVAQGGLVRSRPSFRPFHRWYGSLVVGCPRSRICRRCRAMARLRQQRDQPEGGPGEGGLRVQLEGAGDSGGGPRSARTPRTPRTRSPAGTAGPRTRSCGAAGTLSGCHSTISSTWLDPSVFVTRMREPTTPGVRTSILRSLDAGQDGVPREVGPVGEVEDAPGDVGGGTAPACRCRRT